MLGNWSLGDYFKEGAIEMSFEFLTSEKWLGIPLERLAVTCFEGDSDAPKDTESALIWKKMGIPEERIGYLPKAKNWWGPAGKTGPCGPDTEMFYWVGEGSPRGNPATHETEWLEIWNDVFMQYNKKEDGTFEPLKQKNVDTGMGLERVAAVLQGVESVYETDRMAPIFERVIALSKSQIPSPQSQVHHARIVVDHLKAATFIIADGISPSNVDQGYVLRKIIRRSVRSGRQLSFSDTSFTADIADVVASQYGDAYPHIQKALPLIRETLTREEQQFRKTLQEGLKQFEKAKEKSGGTIDGESAFHLYDTYGFPLELTKEVAAEHGLKVDEAGFQKAFEAHQALSRAGAEKRFAGGLADHSSETTKLHTATHLLNAALRKVLGRHVYQKGSNVTAERLRFDFSHPQKMTPEEIKKVEDLVNQAIKDDLPVSFTLMTVDEAKKQGAIGVFDEKYAERIKVYSMGDFSKEICGGPHVSRTGVLGSFKIQKEEAVSAGIRRLKAVVSGGAKEIEVAVESTKFPTSA
jgi:alanyl-tRNA synthetase